MDSAATQGAAGGSGVKSTTRPGHRKCMSDTFAFVAGQVDTSSGLSGDVDFLDEEGELGLDSEDCDNEMMNVLLDMDGSEVKEEGDKSSRKGGKGKKAGAQAGSAAAQAGGDDKSEDGDGKDDGDPKRAKRIMANRQSAQRSRQRKLQYTSDLEKSVSRLHTEISNLNPQLIYLRNQHSDLTSRNRELRNRITALLQETQYKDQMNNSLRDQVVRMKKVPTAAGQAGQGAPQGAAGQPQQPTVQQQQANRAPQPGAQQVGAAPGPGSSQAMLLATGQQMMSLHAAQLPQMRILGGQQMPAGSFSVMQQAPASQQAQAQAQQGFVRESVPGMSDSSLQWGAA